MIIIFRHMMILYHRRSAQGDGPLARIIHHENRTFLKKNKKIKNYSWKRASMLNSTDARCERFILFMISEEWCCGILGVF